MILYQKKFNNENEIFDLIVKGDIYKNITQYLRENADVKISLLKEFRFSIVELVETLNFGSYFSMELGLNLKIHFISDYIEIIIDKD